MNKIVIPTILAATVLVAGFVAVMPVQQAQTVHTSLASLVTASSLQERVISDSGSGITDGDKVVIDCDKDFKINEIYFTLSDHDSNAGEDIDIGDDTVAHLVVDGRNITSNDGDLVSETLFEDGGPADNVTTTVAWTGFALFEFDVEDPIVIAATGTGTNDVVFNLFDDGPDPLETTDTLTVTAAILVPVGAVCSVDVQT